MHPLTRTARTTGLLYLGVGLCGMLGFLVIRSRLFVADDPDATFANLVDHRALVQAGVALELALVLTQALTAVWFYRLFRTVDQTSAAGITLFGMMNAVAVLGSVACLATAAATASEPTDGAAVVVQQMYLVSGNLWMAGALFFGLWLVPMGRCVLRSGWMPRALGWILVVGGIGYVISAFVGFAFPSADAVDLALVLPATVGEFWMIGYLLVRGVNSRALAAPVSATTVPQAGASTPA